MLDERRTIRHRPVIYLKVFEQDSGNLIGRVVDISDRGLMLVTDQPMESGSRLHLRFHPPQDWQAPEPVLFEAEVRWSRPEANPDLHDVGLVVVDPSPDYQQAVDRLIAGYVFSEKA